MACIGRLLGSLTHALGNTVGRTGNGTGNVGSVTEIVDVRVGDCVVAESDTVAELGVGGTNTAVNNVGE